jgi:hypothetical protein
MALFAVVLQDVEPPDISSVRGCTITILKQSVNAIHNRFSVHGSVSLVVTNSSVPV